MRRLLRGALVLAWLGSAACQRPQPQPRPNVVLISIDTLRADRLGCYGRAEAESPAIDGLAAQGVRFARAYSPLPLTLPAHATMLTGLQPPGHRVVDNGLTAVDLGAPTLAERLQGAGYDTAGFVAAFVLNRVFGLDRGFQHFDDGPPGQTEMRDAFHGVADARERLDAALAWLARPRDRPFFLFLHLYDVHAPHVAPGPFAQRFASQPYDGEVAYVDSQVRRLLDVLDARGLTGNTLVVLTADHGESLGEHGEENHGVFIYDATLHVPLVARLPGRLPRGRVIEEAAALADVAPTVLDLVGLPPTTPSHGRALLGSGRAEERVLWAQSDYPELHYGWARLRSVRKDGWKYIEAPRPELYDLSHDPAEARNQAAGRPDLVSRMASALTALEAELRRARPATGPEGPDEETRARLAALGYATGGAAPTAGAPMDPKDGIALISGLDDAAGALMRGGPELVLAEKRYRKLTEQFPLNGNWFLGLGLALESLGRFDEAEPVYRKAAELEGVRVRVLARLAMLAARRGDAAAEVAATQRLVEISPRHAASRLLLAEALERAGRDADAESAYRESLRLDPASRSARASWCRFLMARGRAAEAEAVRVVLGREAPDDAESLALEGLALQAQGRLPEALARFDAALAARPSEPRLFADRGLARLQAGDVRGARSDFEAALGRWPGYARAREGLRRAGSARPQRAG